MEIEIIIGTYIVLTVVIIIALQLIEAKHTLVGVLLFLAVFGTMVWYYIKHTELYANHRTLCIVLDIVTGLLVLLCQPDRKK